MDGVFVVGTDTEVGKTFVACQLARGIAQHCKVGVYKPVASGVSPEHQLDDGSLLRASIDNAVAYERVCPQWFRKPVAPPIAARAEGSVVDEPLLLQGFEGWKDNCDYLIVEGAGGVLSPITDSMTVLDLAERVELPTLIVARNQLGVVNHTLLTIDAICRRGLSVSCVVMNDVPRTDTSSQEQDDSLDSNLDLLVQFAHAVPIVSSADAAIPQLLSSL